MRQILAPVLATTDALALTVMLTTIGTYAVVMPTPAGRALTAGNSSWQTISGGAHLLLFGMPANGGSGELVGGQCSKEGER